MDPKERARRDKQDIMHCFIILKMLFDEMNKEEILNRAKAKKVLGRAKLIDQTIYEMARLRRDIGLCPGTPISEPAKPGAKKPPKAGAAPRGTATSSSSPATPEASNVPLQ